MRSVWPLGGGLILVTCLPIFGCTGDGEDDSNAGSAGSAGSGGRSAGASGAPNSAGSAAQSSGSGGSSDGGRAGGSFAGRAGGTGAGRGGAPQANEGGAAGEADPMGMAGETAEAPSPEWVNATGNLAGMQSECGNLTLVSATPDSSRVIAGVAKVGLLARSDRGGSWEPLGTGAGSALITNRPSSIVYDPEDAEIFWESGIYNGGGVYRTADAGVTLEQLGDVSHNDLVSVDFTDPERRTLLVGGHEQKRTLYLSTNGGESFEQIGMNLPEDSHFSSSPLVLDAETFLLGACGYGDGTCGIYRSADTGAHWDRVSELPAAARPLLASDGNIYWPLIYDGGLARSSDAGETWTKVAENLVTSHPVELPDGRLLSVRGNHAVVSADQGTNWSEVGEETPFKPSGVTYSVRAKTLFIWHWDCGEVVLDDAIASAGFDYTRD